MAVEVSVVVSEKICMVHSSPSPRFGSRGTPSTSWKTPPNGFAVLSEKEAHTSTLLLALPRTAPNLYRKIRFPPHDVGSLEENCEFCPQKAFFSPLDEKSGLTAGKECVHTPINQKKDPKENSKRKIIIDLCVNLYSPWQPECCWHSPHRPSRHAACPWW